MTTQPIYYRVFLLVTLWFLITNATFISVGNGDFDDVSNWTPRPNNGDFRNSQNTFIVDVGDTLTVNSRIGSFKIDVRGTLIFLDDRFSVSDTMFIRSTGEVITNNFVIDLGTTPIIIETGAVIDESGGGSLISDVGFLPVELATFDFKPVSELKIQIQWSTYTERDSHSYQIFRVVGAREEYIGYILAIGYSTTTTYYHIYDEMRNYSLPIGDSLSYILIQTDYDGSRYTYSTKKKEISKYFLSILMGGNDVNDLEFTSYPNPFSSFLEVKYKTLSNSNININIYNIIGELLYKRIIENTYSGAFNSYIIGNNMTKTIFNSSGIYILTMEQDGVLVSQKISYFKK